MPSLRSFSTSPIEIGPFASRWMDGGPKNASATTLPAIRMIIHGSIFTRILLAIFRMKYPVVRSGSSAQDFLEKGPCHDMSLDLHRSATMSVASSLENATGRSAATTICFSRRDVD